MWHRRPRLIGNGFAVSLLAVEGPTRAIEHSVDLARHDEIVLVQSLDLLRAQRNGRVTPAEADVGVMSFGFGKLADSLHEGERFPEIAKSKRALNAVGFIAQLPIRSLTLETQGFITRQRRDAAATRRAGFLREGLGHVTVCNLSIKGNGGRSAIDLPEHDVERADDRRDIGQHMPATQEIHRLQMGERRRPDLAFVGPVAAVRHQVDAELALGRLDRGVDLAGGHVMALAIELEMVNGRLHRALHLSAQRRDDLVVPNDNRSPTFGQPQLLQALFHDAHRLPHLLHADAVAVVIVAVLADRDVEIELGIAFVGLRFAQIPGGTGAAHHDTGKTPTPGICELDHADPDVALLEDPIFRQQSLDVVADLEERIAKRPDVVEELWRQVLVHSSDPKIVRVHASAGGALVKDHQLLALLEAP